MTPGLIESADIEFKPTICMDYGIRTADGPEIFSTVRFQISCAFINLRSKIAHTNLTEITTALDLLWRNHINPSKVNFGLAFYARSFTMLDPSCSAPGCRFSSGGNAGRCTNSIGTLSNAEIADRIKENGLTPIHYVDAAAK